MSYKAHFRELIWPYMDKLDPNKTQLRPSQIAGRENKEVKAKMAQETLNYLEVLQSEAVYDCEKALANLSSKRNKAASIEVAEFVNQVLRSRGVKREWETFISEEKRYIWPSEFAQDGGSNDRQEWLKLVEQVSEANQPTKIQFLNN
jgi:hypothetical protein